MAKRPLVFLSYAWGQTERPLLKRLIQDLKTEPRLEIWDSRDQIDLGEHIIRSVDSAISAADAHIFIVPDAEPVPSSVFHELQLIYRDQLVKQKAKLLPVIVTDGAPPPMIRSLRVFDLRRDYQRVYHAMISEIVSAADQPLIQFELDIRVSAKPIIEVTSLIGEKLIEYFANNPDEMRTMNRRLFEKLTAELFSSFGYEVELTKQTRDGGRDIIAVKRSEIVTKHLIECKRPDPGGHVGIRPVRELYGVKTHEGASTAILATTAYFSPDALLFFENHRWELEPRDYNGILDWLESFKSMRKEMPRS